MKRILFFPLIFSVFLYNSIVNAATVFTGFDVSFNKAVLSDASLVENQDHITDNVRLTRGLNGGLFNIVQESQFELTSPVDTEWAFADFNNNPSNLSATDFATLTFSDFTTALGGRNQVGNTLAVERVGVLHLISDDIYLDIRFLSWGVRRAGEAGAFSYQRAELSSVPIPASVSLFFSALVGLGFVRKINAKCL